MIVDYADDHFLLKIIPDKNSHIVAASHLNSDLTVLYHFGQRWFINFAPQKSSSLIISLKSDLASFPHSPLFLNDISSLAPAHSRFWDLPLMYH